MAVQKKQTKKREERINLDQLFEGRVPPQALDVERAVIGALLLEKDAFMAVSNVLSAESFYSPQHEHIYRAILDINLRQEPIDLLTVTEELRRQGALDQVGGTSYLVSLTQAITGAANLERHAHIVAQKALSRQLITFSTRVLTDAFADVEDIEDQMQTAESELFALSQTNLHEDVLKVETIIPDALHEIQSAANRQDGLSGLSSGFDGIDAITSGWQNSDLIIIAARPAMGKTAFVLSMARNMAVDLKIPVAVFNLEMSRVQVLKRLISNVCDIRSTTIKNGQLESYEWQQLHAKLPDLEKAPLFIDDTPSLSVFELRTKARRLVREHGIKMIIIDYLQLMNASGMNYGSREQEVSMISRSLKILAKELNIPIVALSQLNRNVETRKTESNSQRPQMSDLRESGAIEQDADMVCFIHRPHARQIEFYEDGSPTEGTGEFIIAKHRNGPTADVRLGYKGDYIKFHNLESIARRTLGSAIGAPSSDVPSSVQSFEQGGASNAPVDNELPY